MALFHFDNNKKTSMEGNYTPKISASKTDSEFKDTVWKDELQGVKIGDDFVKDKKPSKLNVDPNGREYIENHSGITPFFTNKEWMDLKDPQKAAKIHESKMLKIKNQFRQKFPFNQYDVEVFWDGKYYSAYVYDISTRPKPPKLSQSVTTTRSDGIKIGIKDNYDGDINDDDNGEWININRESSFSDSSLAEPTMTIILPNGQKYTFETLINGGTGLVDLRRQEKTIIEFFGKLPQEKIQELIENNVTHITFSDSPDEEFPDLYKLDKNGECIYIGEEGEYAEIISPKFAPPKHNYQTESFFERNDGYKITTLDNSQAASDMIIETPEGDKYSLAITSNSENFDTDLYHQVLMPKLSNLLKTLPKGVINDMLNEIDEIKITANAISAGVYAQGSNVLSVDLYDAIPEVIDKAKSSFIHELGHAIDDSGNGYLSDSSEFLKSFNEFKELAEKYEYEFLKNNKIYSNELTFEQYQNGIKYEGISGGQYFRNHAIDNSHEFFASVYANIYNEPDAKGDHIAKLDKIILPFKDSEDTEKKHCFELYMDLKKQVKRIVDEVRTLPHSERADNRIKNVVLEMGKDIIGDLEFLYSEYAINLIAYSPELTITNIVSRSAKEFKEIIDSYKEYSLSDDYPENIRNAFARVIAKLQEIRAKVGIYN